MINQHPVSGLEVRGVLGRGGTAEVLRVFDPSRKQEAALKVPLPENRVDFERLARRERDLIAGYRFPGLVRLLPHSDHSDDHLLLELCEGQTLDRVGRIDDVELALNLFSALALDLEYLNALGVIHGDLKPHNFFLPKAWPKLTDRARFYIKLSDFSLGRRSSESEAARLGLGTVGYMAPETIQDGRVSHRSDLFALGIIAYQMFTGKHPFLLDDPEPVRVNARVVEEQPPSVRSIRSDIPEAISNLIAGLMSKDEAGRPQSAWDVCAYLADCGVGYQYKTLLKPKHLIRVGATYAQAVASIQIESAPRERLSLLTGDSPDQLRTVLSFNFSRGTVQYQGGAFHFSGPVLWPEYDRRRLAVEYMNAPLSVRKRGIKAAVSEAAWTPREKLARSAFLATPLRPATGDLLLPMLRPATVKRLAKAAAAPSEREHQYEEATHLYVMSGDLDGAERCAYQAACHLRKTHQLEQALSLCQSVIRFALTRQQLFAVRALVMLKGDILKEMGDGPKARQIYEQLVTLYGGHPIDSLLGEAYKDLGDLFKMTQEFDEGLASLKKSLDIFEQLGDRLEVSHVLNNMGNIFWVANNFAESRKYYRQALAIQKRLKAQHDIASSLSNLGGTFVMTGHYNRSLRLLRLSLQLKEELGNQVEIARTLNNLGYVSLLAGQLSKSVDYLRESLEKNRRTGNKHEVLINLSNLAVAACAAGRLRQSLRYVEEGLGLARELDSLPQLADFKMMLGIIYRRMGELSRAAAAFDEAAPLYDRQDDRRAQAEFSIQLAHLRYQLGDCPGAESYARKALDTAREIGEKNTQLSAMIVLTKMEKFKGMDLEALALAKSLRLERESRLLKFNTLERELESAGPVLEGVESDELLSCCRLTDDNIDQAWMCCLASEMLILTGQAELAAEFTDEAIRQAKRMALPPELFIALTLKGRLEVKAGRYEAAYAVYRQALQIVKEIAENIDSDADRELFMRKRSVRFLMAEIRGLGGLLGQKQRAGGNPALVQS